MIVVVDSGIGNVGSVLNALRHLGANPATASNAAELRSAGHVVFPGVGTFGAAVDRLRERGLFAPLRERMVAAKQGKGGHFLGICIGMQLLFEGSDESPNVPGFALFPGRCHRFRARKVPHMGWNQISATPGAERFQTQEGTMAYFVHSYFAKPDSVRGSVALECTYEGERFVAALEQGRLAAVQFHIEKSGAVGLSLLRHWLEGSA